MKKLIVTLLLAASVSGAFAQRGHVIVTRPAYRPHTTVVVGGGFYSPFYSPYGWYGYPYYEPAVPYRPSKLDQEIADINHDYAERIESARMDKAISGKERRHEIRELKEARDHEIDLAKRDYYKH